MIKNIGLVGKMGSGKDTAADVLISTAGYVPLAFATPLKEMVIECDPLIELKCNATAFPLTTTRLRLSDVLDGGMTFEEAKRQFPEVRRTLQRIGQGVRRADPDYWVRSLFTRALDIPASKSIVVTDVRYQNEADALRKNGFTLVRIVRPMNPAGYTTEETRAMLHQSETDLDDYPVDHTIHNNWTKLSLVDQVLRLL